MLFGGLHPVAGDAIGGDGTLVEGLREGRELDERVELIEIFLRDADSERDGAEFGRHLKAFVDQLNVRPRSYTTIQL